MKKIQLLFAIFAFLTASAGVYASEVFADVYYENTSAPGNCNLVVTPPCEATSGIECRMANGNTVWKSTTGSDCLQVFRPN